MTPPSAAWKQGNDRVNEQRARDRKLDRARREALARLGCEFCNASKDEIRGEQARLRADFYARQRVAV